MGLSVAIEAVAQPVERVEYQEVGAEQDQAVGEFQMGDMGGVAGLERQDQLILAEPLGRVEQQGVKLVAEVLGGVEVVAHSREPSTG